MSSIGNLPPQPPGPSSILYIGSIPFEWSEENLQAVVTSAANVLDVRLGFDHVGKNKGYAFVEFENPSEAHKAAGLLSNYKVSYPDGRPGKRLRIESSKEGFRTGSNMNKSPLPFIPSNIPYNVEIPSTQGHAPAGLPPVPGMSPAPGIPPKPQVNHVQRPPQSQPPQGINGGPALYPGQQSSSQFPDALLRASAVLPTPAKIPLEAPDKINETLSSISPPQLIELIANLKHLIATNDAARAAQVFQISPNLAAAAAQALLLMGFVNEEVIQESMKSASSTPQPQPQVPAYQQPPQPQYNNQGYGQPPQGYNSGGYPPPSSSGLPPPPPRQPQYPQQQQQPPSKWGNLPLSTQMKLGALPPDQADLIAQVLSLPPDQISALPPDRQTMVASIRQQYL